MDQSAKTSNRLVIPVSVDFIVRSLCEADAMVSTPDTGEVSARKIVVVPTYLHHIDDVGEHLVERARALPADHPIRKDYDWKQVRRGIRAIRSGEITVILDPNLNEIQCDDGSPYEIKFK